MSYRFATEQVNYEDYASGRVLYNQQGTTSFPVRLTSEIFQRCAAALQKTGHAGRYTLYDPCCGGGYLLTTLGFLHGDAISTIVASDIDESVVALAHRNLSLLTQAGLAERIQQIREMIAAYGKVSHQEALESALRLQETVQRGHSIEIVCFAADATRDIRNPAIPKQNVDMVITDLPYGELVEWHNQEGEDQPARKLLENLLSVLAPHAVVAVISSKKEKIQHEKYQRIERFSIGKRQIVLLRPVV